MAQGGGGMMMMVLVLGVVIVGIFLYSKKGTGSTGGSGTTPAAAPLQPSPAQLLAGSQSQFSTLEKPSYASITPTVDPNTGLPLDPYTIAKPELPIISGSVISRDPYLFTPQSAGMCQCNDQTCCYYAPFHERRAFETSVGPETRVCRSVLYGDQVKACNDAVSGYSVQYQQELKTSYAKARIAHDQLRHLAARPAKAYMHNRLSRARAARMLGLR